MSILIDKKLRWKFLKVLQKNGLISSIWWEFYVNYMRMNKKFKPNIQDISKRQMMFEKMKKSSAPYSEHCIKKDVIRTFSKRAFFQNHQEFGCQKLTEVCKGLALFFPEIGYVQGMNFLAGFFLLLSGFESFETWDFLINFFKKKKNLYFGIYDNGFPVLNFLYFSTNKILQISNRKVYDHLH